MCRQNDYFWIIVSTHMDCPPPTHTRSFVKKKSTYLDSEKSFVLFDPDEADRKKVKKICRKYKKTEEEVLSAAFRLGFPMLEFLAKKPSAKT